MLDIERVVAEHLQKTTGVQTVLTIPAERPREFISVECVGGTADMFIDRPTLAVQSWAQTRKRAAEIARGVEQATYGLVGVDNIFKAIPNGTYRWQDPDSRQERYQTTINLTICE